MSNNGKLGRLRLDTLRDIQEQKRKNARRKKQKNLSSAFDQDGNKVLIISKYDGICAICWKRFKLGTWIWFDSSKPAGLKTAHRDCYTKGGKHNDGT